MNSLFAANVLLVILKLFNSESMEEVWLGKIFLERLRSQHCALRRFSEQILLWLSGGSCTGYELPGTKFLFSIGLKTCISYWNSDASGDAVLCRGLLLLFC